jgi:hypothetical protein
VDLGIKEKFETFEETLKTEVGSVTAALAKND